MRFFGGQARSAHPAQAACKVSGPAGTPLAPWGWAEAATTHPDGDVLARQQPPPHQASCKAWLQGLACCPLVPTLLASLPCAPTFTPHASGPREGHRPGHPHGHTCEDQRVPPHRAPSPGTSPLGPHQTWVGALHDWTKCRCQGDVGSFSALAAVHLASNPDSTRAVALLSWWGPP
jgi:hypothetical protein